MQLRKILNTFLFVLIAMCLVFSLVGCGKKDGETKEHTIYLLDKPDGTWNVWAWKYPSGGDYDSKGWPGGTYQLTESDEIGAYTKMELDVTSDLGILFVHSSGKPQTTDLVVPKEILSEYKTLYFIYGDTNYYTNTDTLNGLKSATLTTETTIVAVIRGSSSVKATPFSQEFNTSA